MRRREFIAGLSGVAAWPLAAQAQQMTTIGYLDVGSPESRRDVVTDVRRGLAEMGYVEGRNLVVEYRWTLDDSLNRLPELAADLVDHRVAAIIAIQTPVALAAKSATKTIPIVFSVAVDPVEASLVASLSRPGGNLTGMTLLVVEVAAKRPELLHEVVPSARLIAFLTNPLLDPSFVEPEKRELESAARTLGLQLLVIDASHLNEIETAFTALTRAGAGALVVSGAAFFSGYSERLAALAALQGPHDLWSTRTFSRRWAHELRDRPSRTLPSCRSLCWPCSQGRNARLSSRTASHENATHHQHESRKGARSCVPTDTARPRGRGDRISNLGTQGVGQEKQQSTVHRGTTDRRGTAGDRWCRAFASGVGFSE